MRITIARGEEEQRPGPDPDVIWEGDEGQDGEEVLPAALCKEIITALEIGEWCRFDDVKAGLPAAPPVGDAQTGIQLAARVARGKKGPAIEVPTMTAAHQMLTAALGLAERLHKNTREMWIRVR